MRDRAFKFSTKTCFGSWRFIFRDYIELCKPRVVVLMLLTVLVGMFLASPGEVTLVILVAALIGIGFLAGSAATINHLLDRRIDLLMPRTCERPIAGGRISVKQAIYFALILGITGFIILVFMVNTLTAILTFIALIGYAGVYTGYLKRATSQNIVIGGLAGAAPPLLGWTAISNQIDPHAFLLVLIIFIWTPPHFWALAIYRFDEYRHAEIPMLPVTHGIVFTTLHILLYTILLLIVSILPFFTGMSGRLFLVGAIILGLRFLYWSILLYRTEKPLIAMRTFRFSIKYLMALFVLLLVDHYI